MFEFGLLNNKSGKKTNFFIMKHLFIEHEYPINKIFVKNFLKITLKLTMNKNQGFQEKT